MPRHEDPKLGEDAKKAFDMNPAPEGKIEDEDLAALDRDLEAKQAEGDPEPSHSEKLAQAPDFDQAPAPKGAIRDSGLAGLDRDIQKRKAADAAAAEKISKMIKESLDDDGGKDGGHEMKDAA